MRSLYFYKEQLRKKLHGGVVKLCTPHTRKGAVLLSYTTYPFLFKEKELTGHTNYWEAREIADAFLARGYDVDVIDWTNKTFFPSRKYKYLFDVHGNIERLYTILGDECIKIFHVTTTHWKFNNIAEQQRLDALLERRGVRLSHERMLEETHSPELADHILVLMGNEHTVSQFRYAKRPITEVPISTTHEFSFLEQKDFARARNNFVWIGGAGVVHKGVDVLLEAFAQMPECTLTLCGKINNQVFERAYEHELRLPNIRVAGVVDFSSAIFSDIRNQAAFVISPSCAEGESGSVIVGMHAGLIPVVSDASGIDTEGYGYMLPSCSVSDIITIVRSLSNTNADILHDEAFRAWTYVRAHHTRASFSKYFSEFLDALEAPKHSV